MFHNAILANDLEKVKLLIEKGADLEKKGEYKLMPLILAVDNNFYEIAEELIKRGADVNNTSNAGPPIAYAA
jgi:ankyrin repeat protein